MKTILGALAITATTLAATAAFAETAVDDQRARLDRLWGNARTATQTASTPSASTRNYTGGIISSFRRQSTGAWSGNFQGGRVHPPAGR